MFAKLRARDISGEEHITNTHTQKHIYLKCKLSCNEQITSYIITQNSSTIIPMEY